MKPITKKKFLADVMHEINMLKNNATKEEKAKLDFDYFNPESKTQCIYGQMTGSCLSNRASELIEQCCIRVVKNCGDMDNFGNILPLVNGSYNKNEFELQRRSLTYISSLEGYIMANESKNERVIKYIKGEIDSLKL